MVFFTGLFILPLIFMIKKKAWWLVLVPIFLLAIYFSGSRGAWLAIGFVGVGYLIGGRAKIIVLLGVLGVYVSLMANRPCPYVDGCQNVTASRERIYGRGVLAFLKRPIFGYGLENYEKAVTGIDYPFKIDRQFEVRVDKAHNEVLENLLAGGIPALVLWAAIIVLASRSYLRQKNYLFLAALLVFY